MSKKCELSNFQLFGIFLISFFLLSAYSPVCAQKNELLGQYYRVMQAYAPGLTGANDFMEINVGSRRQWVGTQQAPNYNFATISTSVIGNKANRNRHSSMRVADLSPYGRRPVKIGLGAYFFNVSSKYVNSYKSMGSVAAYVSLTDDMYLSLGTSFGFYHQSVDTENVWVLYPQNDLVYQDFIHSGGRQTTFDSNIGMALTSSGFYLSYSIIDALSVHLNGYDFDPNNAGLVHNSLGGIRLSISQYWELIPNYFLRFSSNTPFLLDMGIRAQYNELVLFGLSYRNDSSLIGFFGLDVKEHFDFGYSYEFRSSDTFLNNLHTHEITLGVKLLNWKKKKSIW